jgi:hypothetical protein
LRVVFRRAKQSLSLTVLVRVCLDTLTEHVSLSNCRTLPEWRPTAPARSYTTTNRKDKHEMRFVDDEFLLLSRSGSVPPRQRAGPDRWAHMHAAAQLDRRADRVARRKGSRARLKLAQILRGIAAALEGAPADQLRQR